MNRWSRPTTSADNRVRMVPPRNNRKVIRRRVVREDLRAPPGWPGSDVPYDVGGSGCPHRPHGHGQRAHISDVRAGSRARGRPHKHLARSKQRRGVMLCMGLGRGQQRDQSDQGGAHGSPPSSHLLLCCPLGQCFAKDPRSIPHGRRSCPLPAHEAIHLSGSLHLRRSVQVRKF